MEYYTARRTIESLLLATTWVNFTMLSKRSQTKNNSTSVIPFICLSKTDTISVQFGNQDGITFEVRVIMGNRTGDKYEAAFRVLATF